MMMKKILVSCCKDCPYYRWNSGMGFDEDWDSCANTGKDISDYLNTIPPFCKLNDSDER